MTCLASASRLPPSAALLEVGPHVSVLGRGLLAFAEMTEASVASFEENATDYLVVTPHGAMWLCGSPGPPDDGVPWATVRDLRVLGCAFAEAVIDADLLGADLAPAGVDDAANDFDDEVSFV